jgi:CysZ protein
MSFFLERIAATVEALDYPGRGPPRRQRIGETIASTLRLTGLTLLLNLLALPVYLLVPGINLFLFLLGREYFEVVALRRLVPRRPERRATVLVSAYSSGGHDRSTIQPAAC